jgi:hypothetical protein
MLEMKGDKLEKQTTWDKLKEVRRRTNLFEEYVQPREKF